MNVPRLANKQNFDQLWNYYTEQGYNPQESAAILGNIYAESRANPMAINPQDGSDQSDSIGIMQWNSSRADALRNFASQRESNANDLMTQAAFLHYEGTTGSEAMNFRRGLQGENVAEMGQNLARYFIRPAAQHIPQRGEYAQMMYDIYGPEGSGADPMLAFSQQHGEDLSRQPTTTEAGAQLGFGPNMPNAGMDIARELMALANPQAQFQTPNLPQPQQSPTMPQRPQPPMAGPRAGLVSEPRPNINTNSRTYGGDGNEPSPRSPYLGDGNEPPQVSKMLDEAYPAPEGEPSTSKVVEDEIIVPVAAAAAADLDLPVEDAPRTVDEVVEEATREPSEADDEKARNRRLLAADMLEVLSVGLGQMSVGSAVNVGPQLANQRQRNAQAQQRQQEQQAQQQQAQQLAQEFQQMGMPQMARMALSGPQGFETAMSTFGTIKGRAPTQRSQIASMSPEQRQEYLIAAGVPARDAAIGAQFPDLAEEMLSTMLMPDPDAEAAAAEQAGVDRELNALAEIGGQYASNPAVRAAATSAFSNPTAANVTNLRDALAEAGATEAELAAAQAKEPLPLSEGEARFYRDYATPEQIELAKQDPALADQIRNAGGEGLETTATEQAKQDVAMQVPPERIRFLEELADNEKAFRTELALRVAEAGQTLNPVQQSLVNNMLDAHKVKIDGLATRAPMVAAMNDLIDQLSQPNVDRSSGGPFDRALSMVKNMGAQMGIEIGAQEDINNYLVRLTDSLQGEFFQNFRLAGSGATSDKEAENFMNAMPRVGDSVIKQMGLAQRLIRMNERQELAATLEQEWLNTHSENPSMLLDREAMQEFIHEGVANQAKELYPVVDLTSEGWQDKLRTDRASGNVAPDTVVRYTNADGETDYVMYQDVLDALSGGN